MLPSQIKQMLNDDDMFKKYFKFTSVRNPWDRVVSAYNYYIKKLGQGKMSFLEYNMLGRDVSSEETNHVYPAPVSNILKSVPEHFHCVRFENLVDDVCDVCDQLGIPHEIDKFPHRKDNKTNNKHYSEYYNKQTRGIVEERFADDIERFDYEFQRIKK